MLALGSQMPGNRGISSSLAAKKRVTVRFVPESFGAHTIAGSFALRNMGTIPVDLYAPEQDTTVYCRICDSSGSALQTETGVIADPNFSNRSFVRVTSG